MDSDKSVAVKTKAHKPKAEDKLKSLLANRRKNGLCFKCGDMWGHNHKYPPQVSLHVIEELFNALEKTDEVDSVASDVVMAVGDQLVQLAVKHITI